MNQNLSKNKLLSHIDDGNGVRVIKSFGLSNDWNGGITIFKEPNTQIKKLCHCKYIIFFVQNLRENASQHSILIFKSYIRTLELYI